MKTMKRLVLYYIFLVILGFVIYVTFINVAVPDSPTDEAYGMGAVESATVDSIAVP